MVTKKYLCSAPRPESWDTLAESVLLKLSGDKAAKQQAMQQTITGIKEMHGLTDKTGPGRKSNAQHAVGFYEYCLERLNESEESTTTVGTTTNITTTATTITTTTAPAEEESSIAAPAEEESSMDTQTFETKHNDVCDVCDEPGELIMCSTCNLVFHLQCVRPVIDTLPHKDWRCAYCVLPTEPKNTKLRRQAAAAVRLLARMRNAKGRLSGKIPSAKGASKRAAAAAAKSSAARSANEKKDDSDKMDTTDDDPKQVSAAAADYTTPAKGGDEDDTKGEADTGRSRRNRSKPALYDPQSGPARKWQSDEFLDLKMKAESDDSSEEEEDASLSRNEEEAGKKSSVGRRERGDSIWCGFCGDDPSIKICCFCACRVCFGKQKKSKLLLCDKCDDEYHTFCLDPPLKSVPSRKWFCPKCLVPEDKGRKASARVAIRKKADSRTPTPKRASGRKSASEPTRGVGRPRGRPRKTPPSTGVISRKRGRPKSTSASPAVGRKRGRPAKSKSPGSGGRGGATKSVTKARGRKGGRGSSTGSAGKGSLPASGPSVAAAIERAAMDNLHVVDTAAASFTTSVMVQEQPVEPPEIKISRSGRAVRRSSFHDEIEEGDQHLRTGRFGQEAQPTAERSYASEEVYAAVEPRPVAESMKKFAPPAPAGMAQQIQPAVPTATKPASSQPIASVATLPVNMPTGTASKALAPSVPPVFVPNTSAGTTAVLKPTAPTTMAASMPSTTLTTAASAVPAAATAALSTVALRDTKTPRRKPGARECMQISRRFGVHVIPPKYMDVLGDYCKRGKVEHLIRMRERLDDHSRHLEAQLAGLEALVKEKGESSVVVPAVPNSPNPMQEHGED